jgi:hypothetical protein
VGYQVTRRRISLRTMLQPKRVFDSSYLVAVLGAPLGIAATGTIM